MPVTLTTLTAIADGDPVNAATANAPHNNLATRDTELQTLLHDVEDLLLQTRATTLMSTQPVTWGGTTASGGTGAISMASGQIEIHMQGASAAGSDVFVVPYNELASFFAVPNDIAEGEVLYIPFADLDARTTDLTFPYTVTFAGVGFAVGTDIDYWDIPIGRVVDGEFHFCYSNTVLGYGQSGMAAAGNTRQLKYGQDYTLGDGAEYFYFNPSTSQVTYNAVNIYFSNFIADYNVTGVGSTGLSVDQIMYLQVDLDTDGATATVASVAYDSYAPALNRIPLLRRLSSTVESNAGGAMLVFLPTQDVHLVTTGAGSAYFNPSRHSGSQVTIGDTAIAPARLRLLAPSGSDAEVRLGADNKLTVYGDNLTTFTIDVSNASDNVELSAQATGTLTLTGHHMEFTVNQGTDQESVFSNSGAGRHNLQVDGDYKHDSARSASGIIAATSLMPVAEADWTRNVASLSRLTTSGDATLHYNLTELLVDGATYTDVVLLYTAGGGSADQVNIRIHRWDNVTSPTSLLNQTRTLAAGSLVTETYDDSGSLSFTVDKATYGYSLVVTHTYAAGLVLHSLQVVGTADTLVRGG